MAGLDNWILEMWRDNQCDACKNGDRSKCTATAENARCFMDEPDGTRHHYCFIGCLLVQIADEGGDEELRHVIESQFDREGHYEKMASFDADYERSRGNEQV